ncbi:hypothetical protein [Tenacibaculum aiptasiae]|uniref:hypothetical protein n=1 Tax=Tenacibaculum aiptasiae TaxID=426481 RepID=UPI00232ED98E|nr:hypothetical protein [Tenacibaculum aiptasiae]
MENYVIATNQDGRVEAFYIEENIVMHTWQLKKDDKTIWSKPNYLFSNNNGQLGQPLRNAIKVDATSDMNGYIQVVACTQDGSCFTCYQNADGWFGWDLITQN